MNEDAVRDYCCLRLPESNPLYTVLHGQLYFRRWRAGWQRRGCHE